jgi:hypothetical protein
MSSRVLFGQGRRLFEGLAPEQIELERTRILEGRTVSPNCTAGSSAEVSVSPAFSFHANALRTLARGAIIKEWG